MFCKRFGSLRVPALTGGALFLAAMVLSSRADDWPRYRGPEDNGISHESGWLDTWPAEGPKIAWKAHVGLGFSSFVVRGDRVYTIGHGEDVDNVFCIDTGTGKEVWKQSYPAELGDKYFEGGTTGTPTLDGDHLYVFSRWGDLNCYDAASGKVVWSENIQKLTNVRIPDWGFTGAPLVFKNLLILNAGDAGMAVEKDSGKIAWKSENKNAGYSSPLLFKQGGDTLAIMGSSQSYVAVHPENGKEAWRIRWLTQYGVNAPDPVISDNKLLISTGYGKGAGCFDLSENPPKEIWKSKVLHTQLSPSVASGGFVYGMDGDTGNNGPLKCVELATGKERWAEPKMGTGGVIIADGKLVVMSSSGELIVAPVSPDGFKPTARAQVLGGKCWTAPVLANGRVYCRNSRGDVVCVDLRKK